jgi:hypothetical protein
VCGEVAAISYGNRLIQLVSTRCSDGTNVCEMNDELTSLRLGDEDGGDELRLAAEAAARRALLTVVRMAGGP